MQVRSLKTEYAVRPLGTDVDRPRFSWLVNSPQYGAIQTAYQVRVRSGEAEVWDSGKVSSSQTFGVEYDGPALTPRTRYDWTVRVWDGDDRETEWAADEWFETGLRDEGFGAAQ